MQTRANSTTQLLQKYERRNRIIKVRQARLKRLVRFLFGKFESGVNRVVFIRKNHVYKVARLNRGLRSLLYGWIANINEHSLYKNCGNYQLKRLLCPVQKKYLFGIIITMPRCELPVGAFELKEWLAENGDELSYVCRSDEQHLKNFGLLNGKIVCIDYNDIY